jgi:hypothetical protein
VRSRAAEPDRHDLACGIGRFAWMAGPGIVLRCSVCREVVLRIVEVLDARYLDARGAAYLRLPK